MSAAPRPSASTPPPRARVRGLLRDAKGAVYVEFLIAFFPLFFFFLSLVQLAFVTSANLITKHSAVTAARAAIVVLNDDPKHYGGEPVGRFSGKRKADIERAARIPLSTMGYDLAAVKVDMPDSVAPEDAITVRVEYDYHCKVPWGRSAVCSFFTNRKKLVAEATLPNQGATFRYSP
ncbi:MAG TPA: hypothetical protein VL400_00365 [Polyangiaceae bacterium]|nr:hypothetical protein [Polyangiaceae bacterium]